MFALTKCVFVLCAAVAASSFELGDLDVIFHLYTRTNPSVSQPLFPSVNSIVASSFSLARKTIITIHDHGEGVNGNFNAFVVPAHLTAEDVNVLAVDWSPGSGMYSQGLGNAPQCGQVIAQFANILIQQFGYNPSLFRIVGVGLGGHTAGIAADAIQGQVSQIVAIDPSFVGWTHHSQKLSPGAAAVVEVIHATAGLLGYDYPLGDIDFYPNGGAAQTGCGTVVSCSHIYAYAFYAESVLQSVVGGNQFVGTKCESYEDARLMNCAGERDAIFGGTEDKTSASGIYVFSTNAVQPFAQG